MRVAWRRLAGAACIALLQGCAAPQQAAPIVSLPQPPSQKLLHHWVSSGESLYSIAWRYGLDYRDLARANRLAEPYRLQPGLRLSLDVSAMPATPPTQARPVSPPPRRPAAPARPAAVASGVFNNRWQWPAAGSVARSFNPAVHHQGLSLSGAAGRAVKPAAPGVVVYAGEGLRGYGKLVIIKHSDLLLSAYGHNARLKVAEGAVVVADSVIASAGSSGEVYFEIRRDGRPVDPAKFLPAR